MDTLRQDLLFALRLLGKDRAYALAVILTLALCLGANAAVFAVVQSVLIRPLPYPDADRIVYTYDAFPGAGVERAGASVPNHYDRRAMTDVFESVALYQFGGRWRRRRDDRGGRRSMTVTPSFFRVLRATAARGRLFTEAEGEVGREHVAVLAYALAARQPAGIDHVVGTTLRLNNEIYTVVGVLPQDFTFLDPAEQVWMPAAFKPEDRAEDRRYSQNNDEIARLAPGVTVEQAQARLNAFNATLLERAGSLKQELINVGYFTRVVRLQADIVRNVRPALTLLWGGVLVVLLIAGVNLTNLALVRASGRFKELATRHALGASNGRVARQLATETVLLTVIGGALGIVMGTWCIDSLQAIGLSDVPRAYENQAGRDGHGVYARPGRRPRPRRWHRSAMLLAGANLNAVLREEGRSGTAGRGTRYTRRALVMAQVALAFVLLVGAGLLLASFQRGPGHRPRVQGTGVWTGRVSPLPAQYPNDAALRSYTSRALERIRALPGVEAAGATSFLPFGWDSSSNVIIAEGHVPVPGESIVSRTSCT